MSPFSRFACLFTPSLQWVPACASSPPSSVLWDRKTPASPSLPVSGCPRPPATSSAGCLFAPSTGVSVPFEAWSFAVGRTLPALCRRRLGGVPKFLENPCGSVPRARDSGAPNDLALAVVQMLPSAVTTASAIATIKDFGAESARPTPLLPTLQPPPVT